METEPYSSSAIIVNKGGLVQNVHISLAMSDSDAEILDMDSTKVTNDAIKREYVLSRIAELKQNHTDIY